MTYKTGRTNHDFQIAYYLAGRCHTPDAAFAQLCDLEDDRRRAIEHYRVGEKRRAAKEMRIKERLALNPSGADLMELEAEAEDLANGAREGAWLFKVATEELEFIRRCKDAIQPLRRYKHLDKDAANQAAQRDEWAAEFMFRIENHIAAMGYVPHDEIATMRCHPDFAELLLPHMERIGTLRARGDLAAIVARRPAFMECITALLPRPEDSKRLK